jgi:predicted nucleic acid-binding protein
MLIYADGSALSRSVTDDPESPAWREWFAEHADDVVTSPLGLSELRRAAAPLGLEARERAREIAAAVSVVRFFDQALGTASMTASVLPPFKAIHLGVAMAHADVGAVVTYDAELAQVAILHGVRVLAPGRDAEWWAG